jgi:hypothetical protein
MSLVDSFVVWTGMEVVSVMMQKPAALSGDGGQELRREDEG